MLFIKSCILDSFSLSSVGRVSESPLTLNCATSDLPPTLVEWSRSGLPLANGATYQMSQVITNRRNSSYDNLLTINQTLESTSGFYECFVLNVIDQAPDQRLDFQRSSGRLISRYKRKRSTAHTHTSNSFVPHGHLPHHGSSQ